MFTPTFLIPFKYVCMYVLIYISICKYIWDEATIYYSSRNKNNNIIVSLTSRNKIQDKKNRKVKYEKKIEIVLCTQQSVEYCIFVVVCTLLPSECWHTQLLTAINYSDNKCKYRTTTS